MIPDWQLPPGVDRGLWDYLHSGEMVAGYDWQMAVSPLAAVDVEFCARYFPTPGRLIDLGCGTGRVARSFVPRGFDYFGVDLSDEMLAMAREHAPPTAVFQKANLVDLEGIPDASFDYAACLFSTLGMIRGEAHRRAALLAARRVLKPGGPFVLHVHNRGFHGLGLRRFRSGDLAMSQAYGGAPLSIYHFRRREILRLLAEAGFRVQTIVPVGRGADGQLSCPWFAAGIRAYGYLIMAK